VKRYAFDTNVLVSALLRDSSLPGRVFERCLTEGTILVSGSLIEELQDVLSRKKFHRYITADQRDRFLEALVLESELVELTEEIHACRDPQDDHLLALAVNG
jgi:putative PIN family toxin of toxin-antitoxin system